MSDTGKQSPLGINVLGSIMQNTGFRINPVAEAFMGKSRTNSEYIFGSIVNSTCLRVLTWAINDGCLRGFVGANTYNNLIKIGQNSLPAFGNAPPLTFTKDDPMGEWSGQATTGYYIAGNMGQGQDATWIPYDKTNPNSNVTQWGFIRCFALQAWNEFNWNGIPEDSVNYKDFVSSMITAKSFIDYTNVAITAAYNSREFLSGIYSNIDDLMTADIAGVTLSFSEFGQDCITAGRVVDLSQINKFGLPSVLLQTLKKNNAVTPAVSLALIAAGLELDDIEAIALGIADSISTKQQQQIYGSFLIITGADLASILVSLNCKTEGLFALADLLDIKKIFPNSYQSLTVPLYNEADLPTNSKTYYTIFLNGGINSQLTSPAVKSQVGTITPPGIPAVSASTMQTETTLKPLPEGFGSYLDGILPPAIATSAGAFAFSMQQVKNIQYMEFEKFSQIVKSLETSKSLSLIGTGKVPVNLPLANKSIDFMGIGSGPKNSLTMSDFYGCMSGLPYLWDDINKGITNYQTVKLKTIYREMFLAVTWEPAELIVTQTTGHDVVQTWREPKANPNFNPKQPESSSNPSISDPGQPGIYDMWYTCTYTVSDIGGGYGRGGAPAPKVTLSPNNCKAVITTTIGVDDTNIGSMGNGEFGRVKFDIYNGVKFYYARKVTVWGPPPAPYPPKETVSVEKPPTSIMIVSNSETQSGGVNTEGISNSAGGSSTTNNPTGTPSVTPTPTGTQEIILLNNKNSITSTQVEPFTIAISNGVANDTVTVALSSKPTAYTGPYTGATYSLNSSGVYTSSSISFDKPGEYVLSFLFTKSQTTTSKKVTYLKTGYFPKASAPASVRTGESFNLTITDCPPGIDGYWFFGSQPAGTGFDGSNHNFVIGASGSISIPITLNQPSDGYGIRIVLFGVDPSDSAADGYSMVSVAAVGEPTISQEVQTISTNNSSYDEQFSSVALAINTTGNVDIRGGKPNTTFTWNMAFQPFGSKGTLSGSGTLDSTGNGAIAFNLDTAGEYIFNVVFDGTGHTKGSAVSVYKALYHWTISMSDTTPTVNQVITFTLSSTPPGTTVKWNIDTYPEGATTAGGQFVTDSNGTASGDLSFDKAGFYSVSFKDANSYGSNSVQFTVS